MNPPAPDPLAGGARVTAIGLMSGTSADGIDAAVVDLWEEDGRIRAALLHSRTDPYPAAVRELLFRCFADQATASEICLLHALLGELFADAAERAAAAAGISLSGIAFVASHGQTVWHQPDPVPCGEARARGTLQLGEAARIAERLGVPVVSDFRQQDMALGGQGAPLVPYVDFLLFADPRRNRAVQNLGGIGNVTYLPAGGGPEDVIAFDTGPGNALMDAAAALVTGGAQPCDVDGRLAASGRVDAELLSQLMSEPYLHLPPPKSTGRELFSAGRVRELWEAGRRGPDLVSTLTQYTVESIAEAYARWLGPVDEVILGGGGTSNPELVRRLRERLAPARVQSSGDYGIDSDAKEALAFAVLGLETMRGRPSNLPSATGARTACVQGRVCRP